MLASPSHRGGNNRRATLRRAFSDVGHTRGRFLLSGQLQSHRQAGRRIDEYDDWLDGRLVDYQDQVGLLTTLPRTDEVWTDRGQMSWTSMLSESRGDAA